jgi:hypothetical protein
MHRDVGGRWHADEHAAALHFVADASKHLLSSICTLIG